MRKIVIFCLIIIFALGNVCYAQSMAGHDYNRAYSIGIARMDGDTVRAPDELRGRDRHHRHQSQHKHRKHHKHHKHHDRDNDCADIIKGIIILGIVKEIID